MDRIIHGDSLEKLKEIPENSVNTCVTSPPYYGLRDYGTATWEGGDSNCDHIERFSKHGGERADRDQSSQIFQAKNICAKCGARRIDAQIGLEETPEAYVQKLVALFREVKRVLKDDGTLWLNLGSSYAKKNIESEEMVMREDLSAEEIVYVFTEMAKYAKKP